MRKITGWIACLFLIGSPFVMGADDSGSAGSSSVLLGVEGGLNVATLRGSNANEVYKSRLGFVGGAFANFRLTPGLAFQPEILYAQKGGKINGTPYKTDYVEVPLLLELCLGNKSFNPGIILGPAFNSNVAKHGEVHVKKSDVGLVLGGQVTISKFLVSARYEIGLQDAKDDEKIKNGTFTLLVGFSIL
jgi:hypothetical protein